MLHRRLDMANHKLNIDVRWPPLPEYQITNYHCAANMASGLEASAICNTIQKMVNVRVTKKFQGPHG